MKRVITIVLAMAMALSVCSVAYAEEPIKPASNNIEVKPNANSFMENSQTLNKNGEICVIIIYRECNKNCTIMR